MNPTSKTPLSLVTGFLRALVKFPVPNDTFSDFPRPKEKLMLFGVQHYYSSDEAFFVNFFVDGRSLPDFYKDSRNIIFVLGVLPVNGRPKIRVFLEGNTSRTRNVTHLFDIPELLARLCEFFAEGNTDQAMSYCGNYGDPEKLDFTESYIASGFDPFQMKKQG